MNFQQIESFMWVAKLQSFSLAAEKVYTGQSTVSMRVAELEKELGTKLIDRTRRSVRLTPKGRDLLVHAEQLVQLMTQIRQEIGDVGSMSGTVRIGVAELIALTWLPDLIQTIKQRFPQVEPEIQVGLSRAILKQLRDGELDLVLMPTDGAPLPDLHCESLGVVRFGFVAAPDYDTPNRVQTPESLLRWPLIWQRSSSVLHELLQAWYEEGGVQMGKIVSAGSMESSASLAMARLGIAFLPLAYYERQFASKQLRIISVRPNFKPVQFCAIYSRSRALPLVEEIAQLARNHSTFIKRGRKANEANQTCAPRGKRVRT